MGPNTFEMPGIYVGDVLLSWAIQRGVALLLISSAPPSPGPHHKLCLPTDQSNPAYFMAT